MKKVISVLLSLVMLLSSFSVMTVAGAAQAKAPAYVGDNANLALVQSNANLGFYLNQNTGDFAVLNLKS
ncbi:MAG: hypothetical protein IJN82_01870, partial [Clostridia bacterium]|nr:hypothetical protein [Clostridia bacterium]